MKVERKDSKVQPVGRGGSDSRRVDFFNPEEYISSKREWTMMRKETAKQYESCDAMKVVDYFCVVGMESQKSFTSGKVEDRAKYCTKGNDLEHSVESNHTNNSEEKVFREAEKQSQGTGSSSKNTAVQLQATSESKPVVLYSYPGSLPSDLQQEIPSYCFPLGITKDIVGRTASLGGIHDIVYGQHYQFQSDHSFVFMLQTTSQDDPSPQTLYGICCYKKELAHRVPALVASSRQARSQTASCNVVEVEVPDAPMFPRVTNRCYCLLSRVPLFASHFELLNKIISFERNYHIHEFVRQVDKGVWKTPEGLALEHAARAPSILGQGRPLTGGSASSSECDNALAISAATGTEILDNDIDEAMILDEGDFGTPEENSSMDLLTPSAPLLTGATPYFTPAGATNDLPGSKPASRTMSRIHNEGLTIRGADALPAADNRESVKNLERQLQSITFRDDKETGGIPEETSGTTLQHQYSESPSIELGSWINPGQSSERSGSEETALHGDEEVSSSNELLHAGWEHPEQMLDTYIQSRHVGDVWSKIQREIHISDSVQLKDISGESLTKVPCSMSQSDFLAAQEVQGWSICALCRLLDIENIIALLTAILLERQTVIFCPNIGLLSALVLSVQPLLAPFAWHSLMIPVLPETTDKLDLLDAPVPFIFGILSKTRDIRSRCSNLVRVSAYKNSIKFSGGGLPRLPGATQLALSLYETHSAIRQLGVYERSDCRPVYQISEEEAVQAKIFAEGIRHHLMSLTADMAGYMITDVSTSSDSHRCSILLKESFVESFDQRDREFMREFVETQMFTSYCDLF